VQASSIPRALGQKKKGEKKERITICCGQPFGFGEETKKISTAEKNDKRIAGREKRYEVLSN